LQILLGVNIREDDTLLFLDEIQECPQAISALRYFKEKKPRQAVIGAGSLLDFALQSENFKMPVGRIEFLYLTPLSFAEYLENTENRPLKQALEKVELSKPIDEIVHSKAIALLKNYLFLGGMPAIIKDYIANQNFMNCQKLQTALVQTYRSDFGKYAKRSQYRYLQKVFDNVPRLIGQRIKYSLIDPEIKSRDLKNAINLLALAGVISPVYMTRASGIPLGAQINEQKIKINYLDVGLMQNACGLPALLVTEEDIAQINKGGIAEQFVGQELLAYSDRTRSGELYFWVRDKKGSMAEVDYVINIGKEILPIEVKSGSGGKLKSLRLFMKEKNAKLGIKISGEKMSYIDGILSLPFYLIEQLPRLVQSILK
jgi:predicted AAA+ superfamily ATPase